MRSTASLVSLFVMAALTLPVTAHAQTPPDSVVTPPPSTPATTAAPAAAPSVAVTPLPTTPTRDLPGIKAPTNNYWFTLSAAASQPNDSFSDKAEMGSQFLGGAHVRLGERVTLGLNMGASNWSGADIESYRAIQLTLDGRFLITRWSSRMVPFVQVGGGSYQLVSEAEPQSQERERTSESAWGLNYGGGVLFSVGKSAKLGPVVLYHTAGSIPEIGTLVGQGDCKFISFGLELVMPMGR